VSSSFAPLDNEQVIRDRRRDDVRAQHPRSVFRLSKPNIMSLKISSVLVVGMTALLLESTAVAMCPGNVGDSSTPNSAFTVNANGTVVHGATGLMWKQCNEGLSGVACATGTATAMTWVAALTTSRSSTFASYTDWRLPNRQELASLIDNTCYSPAINETVFPGAASAWTFSSTTFGANPNFAWGVQYGVGTVYADYKTFPGVVRLVRGGQSFDHLAARCALDVSGDGAVTAGKDGVLLLRYLLGFRGAALIAGGLLGPGRADAQAVEDFIGSGAQYDVFGRPAAASIAMQDALVLTRLMLGVADTALLTGIAFPGGATFTSGSAVRGNVNTRCGTNY
jgi:hypothetical protein